MATEKQAYKMIEARYHINRAADHCLVGYWRSQVGVTDDYHINTIIESLMTAADYLGFDLVKRQTVDDKALEMHFSDGAIPAVTDDPGFDGRDNSSIEDNLWSR